MLKSILSVKQKKFLKIFDQNINLCQSFYLTGGTALAEFYLQHRYSEDLDFFSVAEFEILPILSFLKTNKKNLGYKKLDLNSSFNRNICQLIYPGEILKVEFTYFPFEQIEKPLKKQNIQVDSILDISVNKIFTIYQKPRSRDFIDLYLINKKFNFQIKDLLKKAKIKFDWHIDPLKLGSQFLKANQVKDYPKLLIKLDHHQWQEFFQKQAKKLESEIFKQ